MVDELLAGLERRDRRSLSRLLSLAARGEHLSAIQRALSVRPAKPTNVIAFTGSAGVGKSTLVGKLIDQARKQGKTVAVLACDPQSPLTGGALLGDRFRMGGQVDDGVFIRSLATPGGSEAIAPRLPLLIDLLSAFGFDLIFLETVGSGQTDTAVSGLAHRVVLLLQPETGDDLQWEKAGVLEVADVIVVHKADLPGADKTLGQVKSILELSPNKDIPVVAVSSQTGNGLGELFQLLSTPPGPDAARRRGTLAALARHEFERRLAQVAATDRYRDLEQRWRSAKIAPAAAATDLWQWLQETPGTPS